MSSSIRYIMGVDGGGSNCRLRLCTRNGAVLGEVSYGSANIFQNAALAWESILQAARLAAKQAALPDTVFAQTWLVTGLAGAESAEGRTQFLQLCQGFEKVTLLSDAQIACLGAHNGENGSVLIIGTGIVGLTRQQEQWAQVGGWGFPLDDVGSGAWIGQQVIRQALAAYDGLLPSDSMTKALWQRFNNQPGELIDWSRTASSAAFARFAPLLLEALENNTPSAQPVVKEHALHIGRLINRIRQTPVPLSLIGGLGQWTRSLLAATESEQLTAPSGTPLDGAIAFAMAELNHE